MRASPTDEFALDDFGLGVDAGGVGDGGGRGAGAHPQLAVEIEREELRADSGEQLAVERLAVLEADFRFGGVDVDVDEVGRHFDEQEADRVAAHHHQPPVGFAQGMLQRPVLNPPAIEEQVLALAGRLGEVGVPHEAPDAHPGQVGLDGDAFLRGVLSEEHRDPVEQIGAGGQLVNQLAVVAEGKVQPGMGERDPGELFGDMAEFGRGPFQEFATNGDVAEQVGHFDLRADRGAAGDGRDEVAEVGADLAAFDRIGRAAADLQAAHLGNGGEGFPAEPERADAEKVVGRFQLAGGMAGDGQ